MGQEIERKFLVINDNYKTTATAHLFRQGYLCTDKERTVRVRIAGEKAFITIKGTTHGCTRDEFEYEIPTVDAQYIINHLCKKPIIEKIRHTYTEIDGKIWEIDEFMGENEGLVLAEIELYSEKEEFIKPEWLGEEITGDIRYYNSNLTTYPYNKWEQNNHSES